MEGGLCYLAVRDARASQAPERGLAVGRRGEFGHVSGHPKQVNRGGPPPKQALKPLRSLTTCVVGIEGEEDAGAARQASRHALHALGPQGCASGQAPLHKGKPVEHPFSKDHPRRVYAKPPKPKHRLGSGERLEPRRPLRVDGPAHKPADASRGQVGNHHHASEALPPLGEQARRPYPLASETGGFKVSAQPVSRRVAKTQAAGGVEADAPGAQVLPAIGMAKHRPEVEPGGRRQQCRVPLGNRLDGRPPRLNPNPPKEGVGLAP